MKFSLKPLILIVIAICFVSFSTSKRDNYPEFLKQESKWVDSVFGSLTPDKRLGQLFMVAAYSNKDMKHVREVRELVQNYNIGGLIFMQGGPHRQAKLTNYYQGVAQTPLLIAIDGEWGLAMRLDSVPKYPRQMTLGAIQNDSLIYKMGAQIASECKRMGIHVNFAPVADVNNNPLNPVIGMRSFGANKYAVAKKAAMYMKGLQDNHVLANGKHFPGHGDTDSDSHKTLPKISHSKERIDSLELYPFKYLFNEGLGSIMVAHLYMPAYDTAKNKASTLSPNIVNDLLKKQLGFNGLVFTDALNMRGVADFYEPGIVDVKALLAGNDVLLFAENVPKAIEEIKNAIRKGEITQAEIDERCKKILKAKYWCGLNKKQHVKAKDLFTDLNTIQSDILNAQLAEASITVLKNENDVIPFKALDTLKIAEISVGMKERNTFSNTLSKYVKLTHFGIEHDSKKSERDTILSRLRNYNLVILQVNKTGYKPENNFGLSQESNEFIQAVSKIKPTILTLFSNPYILNKLTNINNTKVIIEGYEYNTFSQKAAAEAIVGAIKVNGKLPVGVTDFNYGTGIETKNITRVKYVQPETIGIQKKKLSQIDSIVKEGIKDKAFPGCQIIAIKNGNVFYQKSFGRYTYDSNSEKVTDESIYDLASVTKITSSALALMRLTGEQKFDYKKTLGYYLLELKNTNKNDLIIEDVLSHQAGLLAWIPFWTKTVNKQGDYKSGVYNTKQDGMYCVRVGDKLYCKKDITDSIYTRIHESKLETKGKYVYSDLGYYYMKKIIEQVTQQPQDKYVQETFYSKMGLGLTYKPLDVYPIEQIAPTENDTKFRKQLVRGDVHDQGAALLGGVAGHAGLFGTATDVAILMQMFLNKGEYGGITYLKGDVIDDYTRCHFCTTNRRGLCFDKPELNEKKDSPVTKQCSEESYGHSGFTGTFTWVDPKNQLVYVFVSNRVYPDAEENKLAKSGIRGKIHRLLYEAVSEN